MKEVKFYWEDGTEIKEDDCTDICMSPELEYELEEVNNRKE